MTRKNLIKLLILALIFVLAIPTFALTKSYSGTFTGNNGSGGCAGAGYSSQNYGPFQISKTSPVTIEITNYVGGVGAVFDEMVAFFYEVGNIGNESNAAYATPGSYSPASDTLTPGEYMLEVCENSFVGTGGQYSVTITIGGASVTGTEGFSIVYPPDARINWQFGDLGVVLYRNFDSEGNPYIDAYCWDGEDSSLGLRADSSTASGTSADGCDATFYIAPDGTYQFNINFDGKLYEIRCEDLACFEPDMSYYDPNE